MYNGRCLQFSTIEHIQYHEIQNYFRLISMSSQFICQKRLKVWTNLLLKVKKWPLLLSYLFKFCPKPWTVNQIYSPINKFFILNGVNEADLYKTENSFDLCQKLMHFCVGQNVNVDLQSSTTLSNGQEHVPNCALGPKKSQRSCEQKTLLNRDPGIESF